MLKTNTKMVAKTTLGALGVATVLSLSATVAEAGMGTSRPNPPPPPPPFTVAARVIEQSAVNQVQQGWSGVYVAHTRSNVDGSTMKWTDGTSNLGVGTGAFSYQLRTGQGVYHTATMWGMTREGYNAQANLTFSTDSTMRISMAGNPEVTQNSAAAQVADWFATYEIDDGSPQTVTKELTLRDVATWTFNDIGVQRHANARPNQWKRPAGVRFIADPATDGNGSYLRRSAFRLKSLTAFKKGTKGTSNEQIVLNWLDDPTKATVLFEPGETYTMRLDRINLVDAK